MSWRRAARVDLPLALLWAGAAVMAIVLAPFLEPLARMLPPCALHALTGVPCFACGSTRAALALAHGDPIGALALNPLAAMAMVVLVPGGLAAPLWVLGGGPVPQLDGALPRGARLGAWLLVAAQWGYLVASRR